jgi:hypothetical protein
MTKIFTLLLIVCAFAFNASAQTSNRYGGSFAKGVQLFYAEDYTGAVNAFEKAEVENPGNHAAYLWHGLAYTALGELDTKAANIWITKMPYDENAKNMYRFFMGLGYWREGNTSQAKYWLKETFNHKETPAYKLGQAALNSLLEDADVPPIQTWATIAKLPGAKTEKDLTAEDQPDEKSTEEANKAEKDQPRPTPTSGAKPAGGLWRATISNGYKGQTLSFRVSPDGRTISAVAFQGYLICRGSRTENTQLAPLKNVAVSGGAFADTQLNGGAMVRFEFNGTFTSANTASGTYRVMSGTDCDTYKLNWTASRVGQ